MDKLVNQLPCGVFLLDEAGLITMMNARAEQQLGYHPGQLIGQPIGQILTLGSRLFYQTHFIPLLNSQGQANEMHITLLTQTGERIPVLLNAVRELQDAHSLTYCVYLPLAHRQRYEAELIQARKVAEQTRLTVEQSEAKYRALATELELRVAERTKELSASNTELHYLNTDLKRSNENLQQFAFVASHDLQEPLRKIQQFGDLLKNQYADQLGEGVDFLERMQQGASRMSTLIRDLLTFSRITTRQNPPAPICLASVFDTVLKDLDLRIQETNALIDIGTLPTVHGDTSQLGQLFLNLLNNALKFQRLDQPALLVRPQVRVTAHLVAACDLPPAVKPIRITLVYHRIDVADNGIGFDEKYLDRIFQVFQRLHGKNQYAGTGIGLAICQKVVANHGGAITAISKPGQGAIFSVFLPKG